MDPRFDNDAQTTGTLPGIGVGALSLSGGAPSRPAPPAWLEIVSQPEGVRVLDDRSLNGIQVNGRRVEWSPLVDGDEISIGRHTLYFLDTVLAPRATEAAALSE